MRITTFICQYANLTPAQLASQVVIRQATDGTYSFPTWNVPGLAPPTAAQIATGLAQISVLELSALLVAEAAQAANAITVQIPNQPAYLNFASMVPNAVLPQADPDKTTFASYAAQFGQQPQALANLAIAVRNAVLGLSAAQAALNSAATASNATASSLASALQAFETTVGSIVSSLTSAGVTITAPAAISIPGINA